MKPYWLFAGYECHPNGGMHDLKGTFNSLDEAQASVVKDPKGGLQDWDWAHVFHNGAFVAVYDYADGWSLT